MITIVRVLISVIATIAIGLVSAPTALADPAYDPYLGPGYQGPAVSSAYTDATGIFVCDGNPGVIQLGCVTNDIGLTSISWDEASKWRNAVFYFFGIPVLALLALIFAYQKVSRRLGWMSPREYYEYRMDMY